MYMVSTNNKQKDNIMCPNCGSDEYETDCEDYEAACVVCINCGNAYTIDKNE